MNLLWMDVETTGLDARMHEIIDICMVLTTRQGETLRGYNFQSKIKPVSLYCSQEEALKVNGFTEEKWKDAPLKHEVIDKINDFYKELKEPVIPAGWNIRFDLGFVDKLNLNIKMSYHAFDLLGLAWPMFVETKHKPKFSELCILLDVKNKEPHIARGDVLAYIDCYNRLMRDNAF